MDFVYSDQACFLFTSAWKGEEQDQRQCSPDILFAEWSQPTKEVCWSFGMEKADCCCWLLECKKVLSLLGPSAEKNEKNKRFEKFPLIAWLTQAVVKVVAEVPSSNHMVQQTIQARNLQNTACFRTLITWDPFPPFFFGRLVFIIKTQNLSLWSTKGYKKMKTLSYGQPSLLLCLEIVSTRFLSCYPCRLLLSSTTILFNFKLINK